MSIFFCELNLRNLLYVIDLAYQSNIAKNGMRMTIIAFRKYNDIDVQFDDGTVREHIRYEHFLSGDVINMYNTTTLYPKSAKRIPQIQ